MRFFFIYICGFLFSWELWANQRIKNCFLIPISGDQNNIVFIEIENHLKNSTWCNYNSNLKILELLRQRASNLETHLSNKEILKIISEKTNSSILIKINLQSKSKNALNSLEVLSDDGTESYFKKIMEKKSDNESLFRETLKGWLNQYGNTISLKKENGTISLLLVNDFAKVSQTGTGQRSMRSNLFGFNFIAQYNFTKKNWFVFEYESKSGNYKTKEGNFTENRNATKNNHLRLLGGYKYNAFIDFYTGYADYTYDMDTSVSDYFDKVHFAGALIGFKTSFTLLPRIESYTLMDIILPIGFTKTAKTLGQDTSTLNYRVEIGSHYAFKTNILLTVELAFLANQVGLLVPATVTEEKFSDLSLKAGTTFRF